MITMDITNRLGSVAVVAALWLATLGVIGVGAAGARSVHPDGVGAASPTVGVGAAAAAARDGALDPGFGRGGKALFARPDEGASTTGLLLASGGRLLLGGWVLPIGAISIAQLNA